MLQVVKRDFEKLDELVRYTNNISVKYGYLKDYQIIKENDIYNLLLNFNVPECEQFLEFANLKVKRSEDCLIYRTSYNIELDRKSKGIGSNISFRNFKNSFNIQFDFEYDGVVDLIQIDYDSIKHLFDIKLRKFRFKESMYGWYVNKENTLIVEKIDYKIIYNHLVKFIFNRGYLLDISSLKDLEDDIYSVAEWLNRR